MAIFEHFDSGQEFIQFLTIYAKNTILDCLIFVTIKSAKTAFICGDVETNKGDTFNFCL